MAPAKQADSARPALHRFAFDTVTLDRRGRAVKHSRRRARQFEERLAEGLCLEMVRIPGGRFLMGAPENEADGKDTERPRHRVDVPPFYLGKYLVTIEQWIAVMGELPAAMKGLPQAFTANGRQPVVRVSSIDAEAFCARLLETSGRTYRLPSEAEWEHACRAGTTTPFTFGATITPAVAQFGQDPNRGATTPVGSLAPNAFGLFDMHGNVWEWCQDRWHSNYDGAPVDGSAWMTGADERTRVLRGGCWSNPPLFCRSAVRNVAENPVARSRKIGFRVAMSAT